MRTKNQNPDPLQLFDRSKYYINNPTRLDENHRRQFLCMFTDIKKSVINGDVVNIIYIHRLLGNKQMTREVFYDRYIKSHPFYDNTTEERFQKSIPNIFDSYYNTWFENFFNVRKNGVFGPATQMFGLYYCGNIIPIKQLTVKESGIFCRINSSLNTEAYGIPSHDIKVTADGVFQIIEDIKNRRKITIDRPMNKGYWVGKTFKYNKDWSPYWSNFTLIEIYEFIKKCQGCEDIENVVVETPPEKWDIEFKEVTPSA
jgi:hypothetical protein